MQNFDQIYREWPTMIDSLNVKEHLTCKSGIKISVQASKFHYCKPRKSHLKVYSHFEVAVSSNQTTYKWLEYKVDDNIYAYVPKHLIIQLIRQNGGLKHEHIRN